MYEKSRSISPHSLRITRTSRARQGAPQGGTELVKATIVTTTAQLARIANRIATSEVCLSVQSSTDLTVIGVRPPFFLHGNKRNGTCARALPNARTVADPAYPQPLPQRA